MLVYLSKKVWKITNCPYVYVVTYFRLLFQMEYRYVVYRGMVLRAISRAGETTGC